MLYAIVAIILLILDQALKLWVTSNIVLTSGIKELIPNVIHLTNYHNEGMAFGLLKNFRWFFVVLCVAFCVAIIYFMVKKIINGKIARWSAVVVMAGAVGNGIDRVINGYVVDMFEFEFVNFAIFNVADIFITLGGIVFCVCILFEKSTVAKAPLVDVGAGKRAAPTNPPSAAPSAQPTKTAKKSDFEGNSANPFANWEKPAEPPKPTAPKSEPAPKPVASAPTPAPAQQPKVAPPTQQARPSYMDDEFDLESILSEFRD